MSRRCDITGVRAQYGNKVSHAKNRTRRRFEVNLGNKRLYSERLGKFFNLRVSASGLRTIEHHGGLDNFLLNFRYSLLSEQCKMLHKLLLGRDVSASPAKDVSASPAKDISASPAKDVSASPAKDISASPAKDVSASPAKDVSASPAKDVSASPAKDISASSEKTE